MFAEISGEGRDVVFCHLKGAGAATLREVEIYQQAAADKKLARYRRRPSRRLAEEIARCLVSIEVAAWLAENPEVVLHPPRITLPSVLKLDDQRRMPVEGARLAHVTEWLKFSATDPEVSPREHRLRQWRFDRLRPYHERGVTLAEAAELHNADLDAGEAAPVKPKGAASVGATT